MASMILWASAYIGIRIGMQQYNPGSFALLRLSVGTICMIIIYVFKPPKKIIARKDMFHGFLLGVIGMGVYHIALNMGEQTVSAGIASFIIALSPVFATLYATLVLHEKLLPLGWLGVFLSFVGIVLIALGEVEHAKFDFGIIYILISTCASSIYLISAKHLLTRINSLHLTFFMLVGGTLTTMLFLPQLIKDIFSADSNATLAGIYLGFFPTSLAYLAYNYAFAHISKNIAVSWLYTLPLLTSLMGWLILSELPKLAAFVGGLVALSGMLLINLQERKLTVTINSLKS